MRIGIIVNTVLKGDARSTTYGLACRLAGTGHEVWIATPSGFALDPDGRLRLFAYHAGAGRYRSPQRFLDALRSKEAQREWIDVRRFDAILLRFNPFALQEWAATAALDFARHAADEGVVVLNDAKGLARATSKLYLQEFPEEVRPRTLITRRTRRIERFLEEEGRIVLKPLRGYGGRNVFLATREDRANLGQILHFMARDGFVVAQEYLPAAEQGDERLFLLDGDPIVQKDVYAVARRVCPPGGICSNVRAGGKAHPSRMTDTLHRIAERIRPKLRADGMFLVGIDVAGDKILEINVFSPGGLHELPELLGVDFQPSVARAIERRIARSGPNPERDGDGAGR